MKLHYFNNILICSILIITKLYSFNYDKRPDYIFSILYNENDWQIIDETSDSISVFIKNIDNFDLTAMMVNKNINIDPGIIKEIIINVNNYNSMLSNAESITTIQLHKNIDYIDAYQHIQIDFPFFENRQYYFRMLTNFKYDLNRYTLVEWYLLPPQSINNNIKHDQDVDAIYLNYGAGLWMINTSNQNVVQVSYRLFMDPGGSIPAFIVDFINEHSILELFRDIIKESLIIFKTVN